MATLAKLQSTSRAREVSFPCPVCLPLQRRLLKPCSRTLLKVTHPGRYTGPKRCACLLTPMPTAGGGSEHKQNAQG